MNSDLVTEVKQFLLRGNVVDLAVAVVIGVAFAAVVSALVTDILTPIIAIFFGEPDFSRLTFSINDSTFFYGDFINKVFTFVTVAAAIFFLVVKPMNFLTQRMKSEPPADPTSKKCGECLSEIPLEARRCAFCTSEVAT